MAPHEYFTDWKRNGFWKGFITLLISFLVITMLINVIVDPYDIYNVKLLPPWEFNPFQEKLSLLDKLDTPPNVLIIGSSRVVSVDPDVITDITGKPCFNMALTKSGPAFNLAQLKLALKKFGPSIETVVVGVEVLSFNRNYPVSQQGLLYPQYARYLVEHPYYIAIGDRLTLALSSEQLQLSLKSIYRRLIIRDALLDADCSPNGKINYLLLERQIAEGTFNFDEEIRTHVQGLIEAYFVDDFEGLDEERMAQWEEFLDICVANGIEIYAFIPPMHDRAWDAISELDSSEIVDEGREYLERTVPEAGGVFRDFSHIESFGGDPDEFYDSIHQRPSNLEKMIRELFRITEPEPEGESE
jgi:hypothetical protein